MSVGCSSLLGIYVHDALGTGSPCGQPGDCKSELCVDGVCCESACDGLCEACNGEGTDGLCLPSPEGTPCGTDLVCNEAGICGAIPAGTGEPCVDGEDCESGACIDNVCCERACENDETCTPEGLCLPRNGSACTSGNGCASGYCVNEVCCEEACESNERCSADGVCRLLIGEACESDTQCDTVSCADGLCCDTPCGECQRCDGQVPGICEPIPRDTDPDGDCDASCDGNGACRQMVGVSAGHTHTCAWLSDGSAKCWGGSSSLQYKLGSAVPTSGIAMVEGIDGLLASAESVVAGEEHSCALLSGGTVQCWGNNSYGQLGSGGLVSSDTPVSVKGIDGASVSAVSITTGEKFSCAALAGGQAVCWGDDSDSQLGNGTGGSSTSPVEVMGLDGVLASVVDVAGGEAHACALLSTGSVRCWGKNDLGQLGNSGNLDSDVPTQVIGIDGVAASAVTIASSERTVCAVLSDSSVRCWGWGPFGQLGHGSFVSQSPVPVVVPGLSASAIFGGGNHFCALSTNGPMVCWGHNNMGQLGGSGPDSASPVPLPALGDPATVTVVGCGYQHTCVVSGEVKCWGDNSLGQVTSGGASLEL